MTDVSSQAFHQLHTSVQRWVWQQSWTSLRDIQEEAIAPILGKGCDVIISAATAAGKTEAAFLPACSHLAENPSKGFQILYISPLKALINDQYRRLSSLCESVSLPLTPWHGDVSRSVKQKRLLDPQGILLITPESLESLFVNQAMRIDPSFTNLSYVIIDEFHAFIGTERGRQLQSLVHRLELIIRRLPPRIALSATLGDMQSVASHLRPTKELPCKIIESKTIRHDLMLQTRGYLNKKPDETNPEPKVTERIAEHLYDTLRGKSNLVFANSRGNTEMYATMLRDLCENHGVPNEFFPHHGNLSKTLREDLEARLQQGKAPTSAVCTMTLELGIDIGTVHSIAQVGAPHSVSSMRQRLGRSGRRGDPSILRLYIIESELDERSNLGDKLRIELFQAIAMVNLLLRKWYEPPEEQQYHFSTLIQQVLSLLAQYGGFRADQAWEILCKKGPFRKVTPDLFADLLRALAQHEILTQTHDGMIVIGVKGERLIGHYSFYAAFNTPEEFRLEVGGKTIGTLPIDKPLSQKDYIIFAGQRWQVVEVDVEKRVIQLKGAKGGKPPSFSGGGMSVHDEVRKEMFQLYCSQELPVYLDPSAKRLWEEGIYYFSEMGLSEKVWIEDGNNTYAFPWVGDRIQHTLRLIFQSAGLRAFASNGIIEFDSISSNELKEIINTIRQSKQPTIEQLTKPIENKLYNKYDDFLPSHLLEIEYASRCLHIDRAWQWVQNISL